LLSEAAPSKEASGPIWVT